ncbi:MAG: hypothetical protein ABI197_06830 [Granulicella sp.]
MQNVELPSGDKSRNCGETNRSPFSFLPAALWLGMLSALMGCGSGFGLPGVVTPTLGSVAPKPDPVNPPVTTPPVTTAPVTTPPVTTPPVTTAPVTTAPVTTAPVTTAPVTTAPVTTALVTPNITFANFVSMVYGTALSPSQLNATS